MMPAHKTLNEMTSNDLARNWGDYLNPRAFSENMNVIHIDNIGHGYLNPLTERVGSSVFDTGQDMEFVGMLPVFNADRIAVWSARKVMALGEALNVLIPLARPAGIVAAGFVRLAVFLAALFVQLPFVVIAICAKVTVAAWRALRQADILEGQAAIIDQLTTRVNELDDMINGLPPEIQNAINTHNAGAQRNNGVVMGAV